MSAPTVTPLTAHIAALYRALRCKLMGHRRGTWGYGTDGMINAHCTRCARRVATVYFEDMDKEHHDAALRMIGYSGGWQPVAADEPTAPAT